MIHNQEIVFSRSRAETLKFYIPHLRKRQELFLVYLDSLCSPRVNSMAPPSDKHDNYMQYITTDKVTA